MGVTNTDAASDPGWVSRRSARDRRPALVGRDGSLAELRAAIGRAAEGSPSVVLISGETGVGKTAVVREAATDTRLTVLYGGCVPVVGDPLPFAPLVQALRRLGNSGAVRRQVERSPDLARLLPSWAPQSVPDVPVTTSSTRLALFQSVLELVERLGCSGPVLHAVEDLHWADRSTLDLLRYLATNLTDERVVLVLTYRADEVVAGTPFAAWLAELGRLPIAQRLPLERLGAEDTSALVTQLAGVPDAALIRSTHARSAGNPLFIEHLVRQGGTADALPTTLHELLQARVASHSPETQALLRILGLLARPAGVGVLAQVLGTDSEDAEGRARPALDQHVLELRGDGSLAFAHPAFGEVVSAEILPSERTRLHRRAAEVLLAAPGAAPGELARHWLGAGALERALEASRAAAETAEEMYAFADAHAAFARAAELAVRIGHTDDLRYLHARAAQAAYLAGDTSDAITLAEAALDAEGDTPATAEICERLGAFQFVAGRGREAESWLVRALDALPAGDQSCIATRVYAGLAMLTAAWSRPDEAEEWSVRGLAAARASGSRREEGLVCNALGMVAAVRGDVVSSIRHERAALAIALQTGGADDLALAYVNLTHALGLAGRFDEVAEIGREGSDLLTRVGLATQFGSLLKANACEALVNAGRLDEAAELVGDVMAHAPRGIMAAPALIQAGRLSTMRGDLEIAWDQLEQARLVLEAENAPGSWLRIGAEAAIEVELWAGHPEVAYYRVVGALSRIEGTDEQPFGGALVGLGLRALADQAERHRDAASRRRIADLAVPLDAAAARCVASGLPHDEAMAAWQCAERARAGRKSTPAMWFEVSGLWSALGLALPAAYAGWREAEARLDLHADAGAIAALRRAYTTASDLGLACLVEEVTRLAGWHRLDLVPLEVPATGETRSALAAYALTERELEVLSRLAAGCTNRELADALFISVKTASVHVSNILRKLDVAGRHEAARVAHRLGVAAT